jgi:uncharacterized protein YceK
MAARRIVFAVVSGCGLCASGCATVAPRIEAESSLSSTYTGGRAIQDFARSPGDLGSAVAEAMEDLKMTSLERGRDGSVYKISASTADKRSVLVTMRPHQGLTRLACRVGLFGDEPLSKALLERVGVRLGTLPPAPIPDQAPSKPGSNPFFSREAVPDDVFLRDVADAPYRDRVIPP